MSKEDVNKAIKAIGQELIERADDITNDLNMVHDITIYANITPTEVTNFDITKNYCAIFREDDENDI